MCGFSNQSMCISPYNIIIDNNLHISFFSLSFRDLKGTVWEWHTAAYTIRKDGSRDLKKILAIEQNKHKQKISLESILPWRKLLSIQSNQ